MLRKFSIIAAMTFAVCTPAFAWEPSAKAAEGCKAGWATYASYPGRKAFAYSKNRQCGWFVGAPKISEARKQALAYCVAAKGSKCYIIAAQ